MMHRYGKMYHRILESKIDLRVKYIHQQINVHIKKVNCLKCIKKEIVLASYERLRITTPHN